MIYKIRNVEDLSSIPIANDKTKETLYHFAKVFTYEYGGNINFDGGYILYVTSGSNPEDVKAYFDYSQNTLEYGSISDEVCYAIYVISDDYSIVIVGSKDDIPTKILDEIKKEM